MAVREGGKGTQGGRGGRAAVCPDSPHDLGRLATHGEVLTIGSSIAELNKSAMAEPMASVPGRGEKGGRVGGGGRAGGWRDTVLANASWVVGGVADVGFNPARSTALAEMTVTGAGVPWLRRGSIALTDGDGGAGVGGGYLCGFLFCFLGVRSCGLLP